MSYTETIKQSSQNLAGMLEIREAVLEKVLGWCVKRVPFQEREDVAQGLTLKLLEVKPDNPKLTFAICHNWIANWWGAYAIRQHYSLDAEVDDGEGGKIAFGELLVGECEFENRMNGELDGERLWAALPTEIQKVVGKRLIGRGLTSTERSKLNRYLKANPMILAHSD